MAAHTTIQNRGQLRKPLQHRPDAEQSSRLKFDAAVRTLFERLDKHNSPDAEYVSATLCARDLLALDNHAFRQAVAARYPLHGYSNGYLTVVFHNEGAPVIYRKAQRGVNRSDVEALVDKVCKKFAKEAKEAWREDYTEEVLLEVDVGSVSVPKEYMPAIEAALARLGVTGVRQTRKSTITGPVNILSGGHRKSDTPELAATTAEDEAAESRLQLIRALGMAAVAAKK